MTTPEETQAILPVTQSILSSIRRFVRHDDDCHVTHEGERAPCSCGARVALLAFDDLVARQSHSLPGDVGMRELIRELLPYAEAASTSCASNDDYMILCDLVTKARAALTPSAPDIPVQKLHELPEGHRWCRHCEQKDPHCSVCEGVGYLPSALSGDAGEGDAHYTVAMTRRPKEIGGVKVGPGLYRIHWKSGGSSLAAIGMCRNGAWWVAPTNWVEPAVAFRVDEDPEGRWSWASVDALERLEPAAHQGAGEP